MAKFGVVPSEPRAIVSLDTLAPAFRARVEAVLAKDPARKVSETYRSPERSDWLYGMGRDYDDGRGTVTKAAAGASMHNYGVAVDIIHREKGWSAGADFWDALAADAEAEGLVAGHRWKFKDSPHLQWKGPISPTPEMRELLHDLPAVWVMLGAA